ncbi:MAG: alpha/beta hydrolase [Bifidobacteriaceae bacterium]|nr:alpha/beta hydrolase [Bifidobacteriaceae bacterium]
MGGGTDFSAALIPGAWTHRFVSAGGCRFHVAEAGPSGLEHRLVVLVHGFGQFWWAWRHQLAALGDAGYRAVALDLRGYAASDKPPSGYSLPDLADDLAAIIGSLGAARAVVIGQGIGGLVAWTMTATHPDVLAAVGVIDAPHPAASYIRGRFAASPLAAAQLGLLKTPLLGEQAIKQGDLIGHLLRTWSAPGWPSVEELDLYRAMMRVPFAATKALEQMKWAMGLVAGASRRKFEAQFEAPPTLPVLNLQGAADRLIRSSAVPVPKRGGPRYESYLLPGVGHFVPEEAPDTCTELLLGWLARTPR